MAERAVLIEEPVAVSLPPSPLAEFWHYFRENSGAVAGLAAVKGAIAADRRGRGAAV